jgi:hypothetical protein
MKKFIGKLGLFLSCGFIYYMIEILFRGWSHWSMFVLTGFLGVFCIDSINNTLSFDCDYIVQILISTILCTIGEGISGIILNVWLQLNVWDYSKITFGTFFFGQCNVLFCFAWMLIISIIIFYCDAYNYYILKIEPCPYYIIFGHKFLQFKERKN